MTWEDQSISAQATNIAAILTDTSTTLDDLVDDLETRLTAARAGYLDALQKLDGLAVDGLLGVSNSLAYRVHEIERHFHSAGRWFGKATSASGEDHVADRIGSNNGSFRIDAGDNTWGAWVQILGATDTPADSGKVYFDPHELVITAAERTGVYYIQIGRGASGAAALSAGTYTELALDETDRAGGSIVNVQTGRAPAGSKLWARCMCPGQDTATLDFLIGIHEYEG